MALQGVSEHVLDANGHSPEKGELVQAALNLGHSIKILAGNLPCRVVREKAPLAPHQVPALCIQLLQEGTGRGTKGGGKCKTPKDAGKSANKSATKRKSTGAAQERMAVDEAGDEHEGAERAGDSGEDDVMVKSVKKSKSSEKKAPPTPQSSARAKAAATPARTPGKAAKTPAKTPAKDAPMAAKTPRSSKRG